MSRRTEETHFNIIVYVYIFTTSMYISLSQILILFIFYTSLCVDTVHVDDICFKSEVIDI